MSTKRTENDSHAHQRRRRAAFLRKRLTPRVRDVFTDLMSSRKDAGAYLESQALKVAELTVRAEELRAKLGAMLTAEGEEEGEEGGPVAALSDAEVRSVTALINSVTRLESTARRAAADLGKIGAEPDDPVAALKSYLANREDESDEN
jgi:hypothetical protein